MQTALSPHLQAQWNFLENADEFASTWTAPILEKSRIREIAPHSKQVSSLTSLSAEINKRRNVLPVTRGSTHRRQDRETLSLFMPDFMPDSRSVVTKLSFSDTAVCDCCPEELLPLCTGHPKSSWNYCPRAPRPI
jgi:hypothetical protein